MQLLKKYSKYYSLLGFYLFNNSREYLFDEDRVVFKENSDLVFKSIHPMVSRVKYFGYGLFSPFENKNYVLLEYPFLKDLGLDPNSIYIYHTQNCAFIFQIYQEPLSLNTKHYTDPKTFIKDYVHSGNDIYLLKSSFRMTQELTDNILNKDKRPDTINPITKDNLNLFFFDNNHNNTIKNVKRETVIPEQKSFELLQDYSEELINLNKRTIITTQNNGGFIKFNFKNITYNIPKIPFLIWSNLIGTQYNTGNNKFYFDNYTWNTVCHNQGIKTYQDSLIHSDWWIGAGLPIEVYQDEMKYYFEFNKALEEFSYNYIKNFIFGSAITLAGHNLPPVSGKVVLRPQTINDFNEDDIIVLPNASVEFDAFIKKCCKNGKGAVIVEVSNKVSHLLIVSREMNNKGKSYRLLSMPNAYENLKNNHFYTVDTKNNIIKLYYD